MASFILWVIMIVVRLSFDTMRSVASSTFAAVLGSSAAVCSSNKRTFGFFSVAISSVSACLCPPESRPTLEVSRSSSPKSRIFSRSLYSSRSLFVIPCLRPLRAPLLAASARFSSIIMLAAVPVMGSWNTRPR